MDIASRLDTAMKNAGFDSQSALARASGVPQPTIARILKGGGKRGPETQTIAKLAAACNVTFDWLLSGGRGLTHSAVNEPPAPYGEVVISGSNDPDFYEIPKVMLSLSAGLTGFQTVPEISDGGKVSIPRNWADRNGYVPSKLLAMTIKGESMEPGLGAGDLVVINTADTKLVDGMVYAINYEGEAVVKRLVRDSGEWWLTSDNSDQRRYHRKSCRSGECIVVGRVIRKESDRI